MGADTYSGISFRLFGAAEDSLAACLGASEGLQVAVREAHQRCVAVREAAVVGPRIHEAEDRHGLAVGAFDDQVEVWSTAGTEKVSVPDLEPICRAQRTYIPLSAAGTGRS
jgi:hypothetical protein